jgi:hypothetical protein
MCGIVSVLRYYGPIERAMHFAGVILLLLALTLFPASTRAVSPPVTWSPHTHRSGAATYALCAAHVAHLRCRVCAA